MNKTATTNCIFEESEYPQKLAIFQTLPARKRQEIDKQLSEKLLMDLEDDQEVDPLDDSFGDKSYEPNKENVEDEDQDDIEQKCEFVVTKQFGMIR